MPRKIQPVSLYWACVKKMNLRIESATCNILNLYTGFDSQLTQQMCKQIKSLLSSHLPTAVLDDLYASSITNTNGKDPDKDPRLELDIYLHESMKKLIMDHENYRQVCMSPTDNFWPDHLSHFHELLSVNLSPYSFSDKLLEVISECCPLVEEIISESKWKLYIADCYVTNKGLTRLKNCRNLRILQLTHCGCMKRTCRCFNKGKPSTKLIILSLLKETSLQYISGFDVDSLIEEFSQRMRPLHITKLDMWNPSLKRLKTVERLCPMLNTLKLILPVNQLFHNHLSPSDHEEINFQHLASSSIKLSSLEILNLLQCSVYLESLFNTKGTTLTTLELTTAPFFPEGHSCSECLVWIADNCTVLKNLTFNGLHSDPPSWIWTDRSGKRLTQLINLTLKGAGWNSQVILHLCLDSAFNLEILRICNQNAIGTVQNELIIETTLSKIFKKNPLQELREATIEKDLNISAENIDYLVHMCPQLIKLSVYDKRHREKMDQIQHYCQSNNVDLEICQNTC